jgi:CheY-like chemotaxis protein
MPGMNGAELVGLIRELPKYENVPVLMISGAPEAALRRYQTEYQAFLRKPFGLDQFLRTVRRLRGAPEDESRPMSL